MVLALAACAGASTLAPRPALAQQSEKRVGSYAEGDGAEELRGELEAAVAGGSAALTARVQQGLARRGMVGKIERHLSPPARRKALEGVLRAVARELGLDAVVVAVGRKKGAEVALLGVAADGAVVLDTTAPAGSGRAEALAQATGGAGLAPARPAAAAPAAAAPAAPAPKADPKPAASQPDAPAPSPSAGPLPGQAPPPTLIVGLGGEASLRRFRYNDPFTQNLRPYDVTGAPSLAASIELYPAARLGVPVLRRLGIVGAFATSIALASDMPSGASLPTTFRRWRAGLRARIPLGAPAEPTLLGAEVTYGRWSFTFGDAGAETEQLPDAAYRLVRLGLDARIPAGSVAVLVGGGYGLIDDSGPMTTRFPRMDAHLVDARLGVSVPIVAHVEARLWADYTRVFMTMNPEPGDRFVAGGALDQYATVHLDAYLSF